jgi:hypothetical protein
MSEANARELFKRVLNFEERSRSLKWEFCYWGGTVSRWEDEGLPRGLEVEGPKRELAYGEVYCGPALIYPLPSYDDGLLFSKGLSRYFGLDKGLRSFPFNWFYFPRFEVTVLEETEEKIELIDGLGVRQLTFKDGRSMPRWLEFPVKTRKDWEEVKRERLSLDDFAGRYTAKNVDEAVGALKNRDYPMALYGSPVGFFGILRQLIGEPNIYYWFYDHPELLKDIAEHLCTMWLSIAEELTALAEFDCCYFWEDMAYRGGSLVGPHVFKEFMAPYYRRLIAFAESRGIRHHYVDSDGYVEDLLPLFIDVGMTGLQPFEVRAGNDIERVRAKFPMFQIFGGIDKMALQSREEIDAELEKVKRVMKTGGFIPYIDHCVPPDVGFENFSYYRKGLNEIIG